MLVGGGGGGGCGDVGGDDEVGEKGGRGVHGGGEC